MLHPANLKTAGRAGSTGCQRQAPLSSHCRILKVGKLHRPAACPRKHKGSVPCLCQCHTPWTGYTITTERCRTRKWNIRALPANSGSLLKVSAALWLLQSQLCASHTSPSLPSLWHPLLSWPQTAIVGTGSFSKAQSGQYQSPVLGMTPTQSSKYKYLIEKFNLILQNTDTTLLNVAK